jgi:hypothetical protein
MARKHETCEHCAREIFFAEHQWLHWGSGAANCGLEAEPRR